MSENSTYRRDGVMAALSVAEQITSTAPVVPTDIAVNVRSIDVHFHQSPEDLVVFARAFDLPVTLRERHGGRERPYVEARGSLNDVSLHAWALGTEADVDRYRAALASVACDEDAPGVAALPQAWALAPSGGAA